MALADDLRRREISVVYVYTSYLRSTGQFGPSYSFASASIQSLKVSYPELNVQAWLGLPLRGGSLDGYVDLDQATRHYVAEFCAELVRNGFNGVHLDPEPIASGDTEVLALLDEARQALGPQATLSIATWRIWPLFPEVDWPLALQWRWSAAYYRDIARRVDQIAVMTYDSGLPSPYLYRLWQRGQMVNISRALEGIPVELFIGVPTSEEATRTHNPSAENMTSGLLGVRDGLHNSAITGVAIYPYWETDATEWATYEALWLGR